MDAIKDLPPYRIYHDRYSPGGVDGLYLRKRKHGEGTWTIRYKTQTNRLRQMKIGKYPTFSIEQAREIARQILVKVTLGEDPYLTFSTLRDSPTVAEVWKSLKPMYDRPRYRRSGHGQEVARLFEKEIAPRFADVKVLDIDRTVLKKWHAEYEDKPMAGNRAMRVMSSILSHAVEIGAIAFSPAKGFKYYTEVKRKRYATVDEIKRLGEYLSSRSPRWRRQVLFIYMLIFTGARPSTVERTKWSEITRFGTGPDSYGIIERQGKTSEDTGESERIIVPGWLVDELEALLPRYDTILGIGLPRDFWTTACRKCGIEGLWARDLRRTFASLALSRGESIDVVAELLGHKSIQTTKRYAKLMDGAGAQSAARIQTGIESLVLPRGRPES